MTQQEQPVRRARPRPTFRNVQVSRVDRLTPSLVRVTLSGPELEGWEPRGPAEHIRMWFPQEGYEKPLMPEWTDDGPVMPEGHERPISRVYTPRRWEPGSLELDIDLVLHPGSEGPGARWAESVQPGNNVVVAGPAGPYKLDTLAQDFVLLVDHAGLPALGTILETLPATATARAWVEVSGLEEELPLASPANLTVTWINAGHDGSPGAALLETVKGLELSGDCRVFVACEAAAMREIRKHLLYTANLPREHIHTHGYWKLGEANHPDHDLGDDV